MKKIISFTLVALSAPFVVLAATSPILPGSNYWTTTKFMDLLSSVSSFLFSVAIAGAVIIIVYAGILYLTSGFNVNAVKNAKGILTNAIIGVAIFLGAGVIINTVAFLVTGDFFGLGSNTSAPAGLPIKEGANTNPATGTAGDVGGPCINGSKCNTGLSCQKDGSTTMCVWKTKNNYNEPCLKNVDCKSAYLCIGYVCRSTQSNSQFNQTGGVVGESCGSDALCASGLTCVDDTANPNYGTCQTTQQQQQTLGGVGDECVTNNDCESSLYCDTSVVPHSCQ